MEKDPKDNNEEADSGNGNPEVETSLQPADNVVDATKAIETAKQEALYLRAEFENTKKRLIKEQSDAIRMANKGILVEAMNIVDLLDQALSHSESLKSKGDPEFKNFVIGVEMTRKEFDALFQRFGVELLGKPGEKFDPEKHEAVSQEPTTPDKVDTVLKVVQKGASLHGKLLKPARVVVGTQS